MGPAIALLLSACATQQTMPGLPRSVPESVQPTVVTPAAPSNVEQEALKALVGLQDRLDRVAAPLLINNPDLCKSQARNLLGFTAKNKYSYSGEFANAAQQMFGLNERLQVISVVSGSGAARMGLRRGDSLLKVEDKVLPEGQNAERQAAVLLAPLVGKRSSVKLTVARSGAEQVLDIPLTRACGFRVELGNADYVNSYADGGRVLVTRGMMKFVQSDNELAYVIAKEMAHNALGHPSKLRMNATVGGVIDNLIRVHPDTSTLGGTGGIKAMPQELDAAADTLSLYMVARGGYYIDGALSFWQRLASQYPATALNGHTAIHPATVYRFTVMERIVADVKAKQVAKKPLLP
ncbi:M48 family metalloprotease [Undibacterium arcticum]|uniref:M48 family metalloprotease n=2 Tax=Undibacterium arcticum TaxID=1762892 RepID=A0ABV7F3B3_9BURK